MSEFKVGDKVRLEDVITGASPGYVGVHMDGDEIGIYNAIRRGAMAHATLILPERPAIKAGQLWEDARGDEVRIATPTNETAAFYRDYKFIGMTVDCIRNYRPDGTRWREDATGPSYLVKLIEDVAAHTEPCKGANCGCTNGIDHSPECYAEHAAAIAGGKFVQREPKAPPPLDTSKPMQIKRTGEEVRYIGRMSDGRIVGEYSFNGALKILDYYESELENIPTQKRTKSREALMVSVSGGEPYLTWDNCVPFGGKIIARGTITLAEGDGMVVKS